MILIKEDVDDDDCDDDDCNDDEAVAGCGRTGLRNATCNPPLHNSDFQNGDKQNLLKHVFKKKVP